MNVIRQMSPSLTRYVRLRVSPGGLNVVLARVNGGDLGPQPGQGLGDDAGPAAHVQDPGHRDLRSGGIIMRIQHYLVPDKGLSVSASSGWVSPVSIIPSLTRGTLIIKSCRQIIDTRC